MTFLFHKDVFMPPSAKSPVYEGKLKYSFHAIKASQSDRFGNIPLPEMFSVATAELIESEMSDDGMVVLKQVWRQPLDEKRDLVLALTRDGKVKTVWINLRSDKHRTLQVDKYVRP
jgi:hypothetical protein